MEVNIQKTNKKKTIEQDEVEGMDTLFNSCTCFAGGYNWHMPPIWGTINQMTRTSITLMKPTTPHGNTNLFALPGL